MNKSNIITLSVFTFIALCISVAIVTVESLSPNWKSLNWEEVSIVDNYKSEVYSSHEDSIEIRNLLEKGLWSPTFVHWADNSICRIYISNAATVRVYKDGRSLVIFRDGRFPGQFKGKISDSILHILNEYIIVK